MFKTVDVSILGLIQNMSLFHCPNCDHETHIFGSNKRVEKLCEDTGLTMLGDIPLHPNIGDDGERGKPTAVAEPESVRGQAFAGIARAIAGQIGLHV